jgi:hypothetical protein
MMARKSSKCPTATLNQASAMLKFSHYTFELDVYGLHPVADGLIPPEAIKQRDSFARSLLDFGFDQMFRIRVRDDRDEPGTDRDIGIVLLVAWIDDAFVHRTVIICCEDNDADDIDCEDDLGITEVEAGRHILRMLDPTDNGRYSNIGRDDVLIIRKIVNFLASRGYV